MQTRRSGDVHSFLNIAGLSAMFSPLTETNVEPNEGLLKSSRLTIYFTALLVLAGAGTIIHPYLTCSRESSQGMKKNTHT